MASKNGVVTTQIKERIETLLAEPYHKLAFNFLDKIKLIDKNMYKLQKEIEELEKLTYKVANGSQVFTKKHPALESYEAELKLYNATVKELMNYIRSSQVIEGSNGKDEDEFEKAMREFDDDFKKG